MPPSEIERQNHTVEYNPNESQDQHQANTKRSREHRNIENGTEESNGAHGNNGNEWDEQAANKPPLPLTWQEEFAIDPFPATTHYVSIFLLCGMMKKNTPTD
ncbi:hypothetical protein R1flu_013210 [Riccia fluitans]|uniref:Uncharacterized protein n=1 Tax=Riccia fluitans TaxID=41844 RepID=A0ABD1YG64_9MARC